VRKDHAREFVIPQRGDKKLDGLISCHFRLYPRQIKELEELSKARKIGAEALIRHMIDDEMKSRNYSPKPRTRANTMSDKPPPNFPPSW
jgi:hypothetical protein